MDRKAPALTGFRNLFFDLDGTLVNSLPGIEFSVREAIERCGIPTVDVSLAGCIGPPIRTILGRLTGQTASSLDRLEREFRASYDSLGWRQTVLYPHAAEVLRELQESGKRLFLVTNKPAAVTSRILSAALIKSHFTGVLARDSRHPVFGSKAEMLACLVREYALTLTASLMIGDTQEDIDAAGEAGIAAIAVTYGYGSVRTAYSIGDLRELSPQAAAIG